MSFSIILRSAASFLTLEVQGSKWSTYWWWCLSVSFVSLFYLFASFLTKVEL